MNRPTRVGKHAIYKGVRVTLDTEKDDYYNVLVDSGKLLDKGFMLDMLYEGHTEYYGRIRKDDPELRIVE